MKNWQIFFKTITILSCVTCYMLHVTRINAQQLSLSLSPPLVETVIKPGKSILVAYKVENLADPAIIKAKIVSSEPKDNFGNAKIKTEFEGPIRFGLDNTDIQLEQPILLKTRNSQQLLLRIRVPEGAPEGDYYYTLLVETEPPPVIEGISSARAKALIGSNILITVSASGNIDLKGKLNLFDVIPRYQLKFLGLRINLFDSSDKIPVVAIVENKGKNLFRPQGEIVLKGNFGEKAKYEIIPQNILVQSQRELIASPSAVFDCASNRKANYCKRPITLLISGFFIGFYKLSTTISLGDNLTNLYASTSFIALPFKFFIVLVAVVIVASIIIKRNREES